MFIFRWIRNLIILFFASSILMVLVYRVVPVYFTPLMFIRVFQQVADGEAPKLHHKWVPLEEISPKLPRAVIASEDNLFMKHHGFDFNQIEKAVAENKRRKKARGASTISQQTAKNVFLWPTSSFIRKGFEVYFTVLIEFVWGKERIMEVYLNSIEMGDGIYGAESVAQLHFDKSAKELTSSEAATIAATLPNPIRFNSAHPSAYIRKRREQIVRQMPHMGKIDFLDKHKKKKED
ncbi:MAG: monofunctional biosynthetic peptidoglycan transglycosylase [Bacteroidota bacterium]|nr:monofunctional biosynthetic peptidoglycan transglycosylase [Bacteroidota bacterium]